jgi:REP element-mobilizing transposase RayT
MTYDPDIHHRQSLRWNKHNYSSPGFYYVTICIQDHRSLLGNVQSGVMNLNDAGEMVDAAWLRIPMQFPTIQLDEHITMPNHFHGIIQIVGRETVGVPPVGTQRSAMPAGRAGTRPAPTLGSAMPTYRAPTRGAPTLGDVVGGFKSQTTDEYIVGVDQVDWPRFQKHFWQRNYYDHVIRDHDELEKIRDYIRKNPLRWTLDRYNPENPALVMDDTGALVPWDES